MIACLGPGLHIEVLNPPSLVESASYFGECGHARDPSLALEFYESSRGTAVSAPVDARGDVGRFSLEKDRLLVDLTYDSRGALDAGLRLACWISSTSPGGSLSARARIAQ